MSYIKRHLENISVQMGLDGEITEAVMQRFYRDDNEGSLSLGTSEVEMIEAALYAKDAAMAFEAALRFLKYAKDAANWNSKPWVNNDDIFDTSDDGAIKQNARYIMHMKKRSWIETHVLRSGETYFTFTDKGREFALRHGITVAVVTVQPC